MLYYSRKSINVDDKKTGLILILYKKIISLRNIFKWFAIKGDKVAAFI